MTHTHPNTHKSPAPKPVHIYAQQYNIERHSILLYTWKKKFQVRVVRNNWAKTFATFESLLCEWFLTKSWKDPKKYYETKQTINSTAKRDLPMGWDGLDLQGMSVQSSLPLCETELSPSQQLFLRHTCLSCPRKDTSEKHACMYVYIQACKFFRPHCFWKF